MIEVLIATKEDGLEDIYLTSGTGYTTDTLILKKGKMTLKDVLYLIQWLINHSMQAVS